MADEEDPGDVFAIPDLWGLPRFFVSPEKDPAFLFSPLKIEEALPSLPGIVDETPIDSGFFAIPDLSFGTTDGPETPATSVEDQLPEKVVESESKSPIDIWNLPNETSTVQSRYLSWNDFLTEGFGESPTIYISEAGPGVFDAALAQDSKPLGLYDNDTPIIDSYLYATSLLALGLSRSSVLFSWNEDLMTFEPKLKHMRISGCTVASIQSVQATFLECGNYTRMLQSFVEKIYSNVESPCRVALADAVSTLLKAVQIRMNISPKQIRSIIQLQALFAPLKTLLSTFNSVIETASLAENDEVLLSRLYEEMKTLEYSDDEMRTIFLEVIARVSRPFLNFSEEWLGLQPESGVAVSKEGTGKSFVKLEDRYWIDEQGLEMHDLQFALDSEKVPSFLSHEDAQIMFETGRSLRFMRDHHSDHPLVNMDVVSSVKPPKLEWEFSWQKIEQIETRASQYKKDLLSAIKTFSVSKSSLHTGTSPSSYDVTQELDLFGKPEKELEACILDSISTLSRPLQDINADDRLAVLINQSLVGREQAPDDWVAFPPPLSLLPNLSFSPIIAAQAKVVNGTSIRLFFQSHNLRDHLSLQRHFHLLGNGVFSSRLSHALFDPDLETAERHAGVARSGDIMGLRLGGRNTWPPASSELRLALMGVLTESYHSTQPSTTSTATRGGHLDRRTSDLPGDLSFAVRDLSEDEIKKCLDPDSVEALDFLRLSYRPPAPLDAIITPMCLYKYDQLFRLLLRVLRMLYVVNQLFRDATGRSTPWRQTLGADENIIATRFRIEAHHFVSTIGRHFLDTGIGSTWKVFERRLEQVECRINAPDEEFFATLSQHEGLNKLEEYHSRVLDRIMTALFLRKRQQPVMQLLEEIFTTVLGFVKWSRFRVGRKRVSEEVEEREDQQVGVKELYARFRRKVEVFVTVCRGLSEKKGFGDKKEGGMNSNRGGGNGGGEALFDTDELAEENTVVHLLVQLDMSGYYSRPSRS